MTENHPITPPPELVQQWFDEGYGLPGSICEYVATRAAQWCFDQANADIERERQEAADQELEACLNCMNEWGAIHNSFGGELADDLRAARRPKPLSLKERIKQAISSSDTGLAIYFSDDRIIIESSILDLTNRANLANDLRQVADALSPGAVGGFNG